MNLPAEKSHFMNTTRKIDELAKINKQARDDDGPGAEHVVELEEVEDLHHAQEEGPGQHLVPVQENIQKQKQGPGEHLVPVQENIQEQKQLTGEHLVPVQ